MPNRPGDRPSINLNLQSRLTRRDLRATVSTPPAQPEAKTFHFTLPRSVTPTSPAIRLSIPRAQISGQINAAEDRESLFEGYWRDAGLTANKSGTALDNLGDLETELEAVSTSSQEFSDASFDVLDPLGERADGVVHRVRVRATGIIMARKTIATHQVPRKQLERELSIAASTIRHINIIKWHGTYTTTSSPPEINIVMEYCSGGSLEFVASQLKGRGVVKENIFGRISEGILQGLDYLYSRKFIHGDIKPSNVLLDREGVVKLCDFDVFGEHVKSNFGTFSIYMAPERINGQEHTIRSDVWSTGIMLLELVQRRFPFPLPPNIAHIELMQYIAVSEPPQLEDEDGVHWSDEMKDFVKQMLVADAWSRPGPSDMLNHAWIVNVMKQEVNMPRWIRQVCGWPKLRDVPETSVDNESDDDIWGQVPLD